jgi:DNA-binding response OmpR family regulator
MSRVLVIDDDFSIRTMLRRALTLEGFEVELASDGISGLSAALKHHPDAVVLDNRMPGLGGLGVLNAFRAEGLHTPTVLLTGDDDPTLVADAKIAGADFFLRKPVSLAALMAILHALLDADPANPQAGQQGPESEFEG